MALKTDYATQLKELKDIIETINTIIKLLENRITTKQTREGYAKLKHKQKIKALDLAKKK